MPRYTEDEKIDEWIKAAREVPGVRISRLPPDILRKQKRVAIEALDMVYTIAEHADGNLLLLDQRPGHTVYKEDSYRGAFGKLRMVKDFFRGGGFESQETYPDEYTEKQIQRAVDSGWHMPD